MNRVGFTVALATLALLGGVRGTAAEESTSLLTTIEVQRLVARSEPADHARLRDHFAALADSYHARAERHERLSRAVVGNPNRGLGVWPRTHQARLATAARESATTLRQLAVHHERLAAGVSSSAPPDSERFEAGAGAAEPSAAQLAELAETARTPAEHRSLEAHFLTVAERHTNVANRHRQMAVQYRARANTRGGGNLAAHCDRIVKSSLQAASAARTAANGQRPLATAG